MKILKRLRIRMRWGLPLVCAIVCLLAGVPFTQAQRDLDLALAKMEAAGGEFRSFSAAFVQRKYTAVLREFDIPESGEFHYARAKDGSALLRQEVIKPAPRILTIKGGVATVYQPGIKQAQIVNLGKNRDKVEFLALGLGQRPGRLRESFAIAYQASESIAGAPCWVLVLSPKNPAAAAYFTSITLWIKKANGVPIQEKLQEPNRDYLLVTFSGEKLNAPFSASKFEQRLPPGTDIQTLR